MAPTLPVLSTEGTSGVRIGFVPPTPLETLAPCSHSHYRQASTDRHIRESLVAFSRDALEGEDGERVVNQYIINRQLGKGGYANVQLALDRENGIEYAVKEFSKSRLRKIAGATAMRNARALGQRRMERIPVRTLSLDEQSLANLGLIRSEVAILKKLHHPSLCNIREVVDIVSNTEEENESGGYGDSILIVMELCTGGPIWKEGQICPEPQARGIMRQVLAGLAYLHHNGILHRDIKPDNILFLDQSRNRIRIIDFGVSTMFTKSSTDKAIGHTEDDDTINSTVGTPAYLPPELCARRGGVHGAACDIWSLGVTLFQLTIGSLPFVASNLPDLFQAIEFSTPLYPSTLSPPLLNLLQSLLEKDPTNRPTIKTLWRDPFLTENHQVPLPCFEENTLDLSDTTEEELLGAFGRLRSFGGASSVFKAVGRFRRANRRSLPSSAPAADDVTGADGRMEMEDGAEIERAMSPLQMCESP